jgi:hypothetical protein
MALVAAAVSAAQFMTALGVSPANAQQLEAKNALPNAAQEIVFTSAQCRRILATVTSTVGKYANKSELSREFRQSWINFVMDGGQMTCTGPRVITWRTREDLATYGNIVSRLEQSDDHIDLQRAGVSLASTPAGPVFTGDECSIVDQAYTAALNTQTGAKLTEREHVRFINWLQDGCPDEFRMLGNDADEALINTMQRNITTHPDPGKRIDTRWRIFFKNTDPHQ